MKTPKRDPRTGRFVKAKTSSRSTSRDSSPWGYRANPKKATRARKPKARTAKKTAPRKSSFWGW